MEIVPWADRTQNCFFGFPLALLRFSCCREELGEKGGERGALCHSHTWVQGTESRRCGEKPFKVVVDVWGLILFSKTYLLDVSTWEVIRALLPFRGWGRRELGCGVGRQEYRCWEREPPCDQQAPAEGPGGKGCISLSSAEGIAGHSQALMFKITQVCDCARSYSGDKCC